MGLPVAPAVPTLEFIPGPEAAVWPETPDPSGSLLVSHLTPLCLGAVSKPKSGHDVIPIVKQ